MTSTSSPDPSAALPSSSHLGPSLPTPPEEPLLTGSKVAVKTNDGHWKHSTSLRTPNESPTAATGSTARVPSAKDADAKEESKVASGSGIIARRTSVTDGPPASKDNTFYFSSIFVQLSDKTVTIPRQPLFEKSAVLRNEISYNKNIDVGLSPENPVKLEWTSSEEFGTFMDELLGFSAGKLDSEKWIRVLNVAHRMQVSDLREAAVRNLQTAVLPHHTVLCLARGHGLIGDRWRRLSFEEIVLAPKLPTLSEAEDIGWNWMLKLARLREKRLFENMNLYHLPVLASKSLSAKLLAPFGKPKKAFAYCRKDNLVDIYPASGVEFPSAFQRPVLENAYKRAFGRMDKSATVGEDSPNIDAESDNSQDPGSSSNRAFNVSYIVLKVDKTLFRVPRDIFEEKTSSFMSRYDITDKSAGSEEDPVMLDDVSVDDFKSFLKCATNTSSGWEPKEIWVTAIKLARMWRLKRPRNVAIAKLEEMKLDAVTRIELAQTCDIDSWLRPAIMGLALQRSTPTEATVTKIGSDTTLRLLELREEIVPERQRVLYTLLLKDAEEKKDDPKNMKCRFCGTRFLPDVSCVDLSEDEVVAMVRKLVAEEFCGGSELHDEQREKDKSTGSTSTKHLTRRGSQSVHHSRTQDLGELKRPAEARRGPPPPPVVAATA